MKEKDFFWLSFCSLFGAWKIVGIFAEHKVWYRCFLFTLHIMVDLSYI